MSAASFIDRKARWSLETFGPGLRTKGILAHIRKELAEIEDEPLDLIEWCDVILLALDGASRSGASGEEIVAAITKKHALNLTRQWLRSPYDEEFARVRK